ncbi:ANTAR domain-containing response regulator [Halomonas sp. AOP13-D3-9]
MTATTRRNFRGHRALIVCAAEKDRAVLTQFLVELGVTPVVHEGHDEAGADKPFDLVFFDDELGRQFGAITRMIDSVQGPAIALIGSDAPSSVNWFIERRVCGYLTKPLRKAGILASLIIAYQTFNASYETEQKLQRLEQQVRARQVVCTAAIKLIEEMGVSVNDAFALLRSASMNRRLSLEDCSAMIVSGEVAVAALKEDVDTVHRLRENRLNRYL